MYFGVSEHLIPIKMSGVCLFAQMQYLTSPQVLKLSILAVFLWPSGGKMKLIGVTFETKILFFRKVLYPKLSFRILLCQPYLRVDFERYWETTRIIS